MSLLHGHIFSQSNNQWSGAIKNIRSFIVLCATRLDLSSGQGFVHHSYIYIYTYTYRSSTRLRGRLVDGQICASQSSGDSLAQVLVKLQIPSWPQGLSIFDLPGGKRQVEERGS